MSDERYHPIAYKVGLTADEERLLRLLVGGAPGNQEHEADMAVLQQLGLADVDGGATDRGREWIELMDGQRAFDARVAEVKRQSFNPTDPSTW